MPIYEQFGPYVIQYAMHIPLAILGFVLMYKAGVFDFKKPSGKIIFVITLLICLIFPLSQAYWHFGLPLAFPLHESILG